MNMYSKFLLKYYFQITFYHSICLEIIFKIIDTFMYLQIQISHCYYYTKDPFFLSFYFNLYPGLLLFLHYIHTYIWIHTYTYTHIYVLKTNKQKVNVFMLSCKYDGFEISIVATLESTHILTAVCSSAVGILLLRLRPGGISSPTCPGSVPATKCNYN